MAQIECGRGHLYDPEVHPICPYCNAGRAAPIGGIPVTAPQKTAPIGAIPVTEAQKTAPPRGYNPALPLQGNPQPASPFGGISVTAASKTVGMMQSQMGFNPVVGWFVCVEGPSRGKSYSIYVGINSVGRSEKMDIAITGDRKISMENHVKVSYSDKHNRFNLIPGDGRNIVYLNDEELFTPMPLRAYDLIDFGETKLLFIPLCGEKFQWKAGEKEAVHGTV